jgi:2,5-diketo-D-gluconate reductase B
MVPFIESHSARIPAIGLGTMTLKDELCVRTVSMALQMGYRHLDTATFYGNEKQVGEGLRTSGVKREELFLTTKVRHIDLKPGDFERAVETSLAQLDVSQVDLLLIHWPSPELALADYIPALCRAKRSGQARHIGVANFTIQLLDEALKIADEPLVNNQIEAHPMLDQTKLIAHCKKLGLSITAYCPIGRGKVPGTEMLDRIGARYGKSGPQVSLRWLIQNGLIPIPRTANADKLRQNLDVFDFSLSDAEMAEIATLRRPDGRIVNPPQAPVWDA